MSKKIIGATVGTSISTDKIGRDLKPKIEESIGESMTDVTGKLSKVEAIAKGRNTGYVFGYEKDMLTWISNYACFYYDSNIEYPKKPEIDKVVICVSIADDGDTISAPSWCDKDGFFDGFIFYNDITQRYYQYWDCFLYSGISASGDYTKYTKIYHPLQLGDNLYIRDTGVPDYWWDGSAPQILETQFVDVDQYVTNEAFNKAIGDIENSLGSIIALQNSLIGGETV